MGIPWPSTAKRRWKITKRTIKVKIKMFRIFKYELEYFKFEYIYKFENSKSDWF